MTRDRASTPQPWSDPSTGERVIRPMVEGVAAEEPMAKVVWDFTVESYPTCHLCGEREYPTVSMAKRAVEALDDCWGQGTHHVVTLNETESERKASHDLNSNSNQGA